MRLLALDSTTRDGSVALLEVNASQPVTVLEERAGDHARSHAERLPSELIAVLAAHQLRVADVDLFAVASGPGSFTGLRIGIATMQGFALAMGRPLIGVSALEATVVAVAQRAATCAAWMDAYRRDVFTGLYQIDDNATVAIEGPTVGDPAATLGRWRDAGWTPSVFVGSGAPLYAGLIAAAFPTAQIVPAPLLAGAVGRLAAARFAAGESPHPAALQPLYVRRPDAELAREKTRAGS